MPSPIHNRLVEQLGCLGFRTPGTRPTMREAVAQATGAPMASMRREHLKLPIPDAWAIVPEYRTVICVEVDITHRADLGKYGDLWWWLDEDDWHLYVVRGNHEGLFWPVDIHEWVHREGCTPKNNAVPYDDRERYDKVLALFGLKLAWPPRADEVVLRRRQPNGSDKIKPDYPITMTRHYGDDGEPPP